MTKKMTSLKRTTARHLYPLLFMIAAICNAACAPIDPGSGAPAPLPIEALRIVNESLADAVVGGTYSQTITAVGSLSPSLLTWAISDDSLPPGLNFYNPGGASATIGGIPSVAGDDYVFALTVSNGSDVAVREFTIRVKEDDTKLLVTSNLDLTVFEGETLSKTLRARGGTEPYTWAISALPGGALPAWPLAVNAITGVLTATPATGSGAASVTFNISVNDARPGVPNVVTTIATLTVIPVGAPPLVGLTTTIPAIVEGASYSSYITVSGGTAPYTWSATLSGGVALPAWVEIDAATGALWIAPPLGTATPAEDLLVTVVDSSDPVQTRVMTLPLDVISAPSNAVRIVTSAGYEASPEAYAYSEFLQTTSFELPFAYIGKTYHYEMQAMGGAAPYAWSANGLPAWLVMDADGTLQSNPNVPSVNGLMTRFIVTVQDANGQRFSGTCIIAIEGTAPLDIVPWHVSGWGGGYGRILPSATLPPAVKGQHYLFPLMAYGGTAPIHYEVSGAPTWISVDNNGSLRGTLPFAPAFPYSITVTATDSSTPPQTSSATYTLSVLPETALALESHEVHVVRNEQFLKTRVEAEGGDGVYTFSIAEGALPSGLSLDFVTGILSGRTDANSGTYDLALKVSDGKGGVATAPLSIIVTDPVSGTMVTIAHGYGRGNGDGGPAGDADFGYIDGCCITGNALILATNVPSYAIRRIDLESGIITTLAGNKNSQGGSPDVNIPAVNASLGCPWDIEADAQGNLYFLDGIIGFRVLKIEAATGMLRQVASFTGLEGTQQLSLSPNGDALYIGMAINARVVKIDLVTGGISDAAASLNYYGIYGVAAASNGNLYFHDSGTSVLYKKDGATGVVSTIRSGIAMQAIREHPQTGELYFAAYGSVECMKRDTNGLFSADSVVERVAGGGTSTEEGILATEANLYGDEIHDLDFDTAGNMYIVGVLGSVKKILK